MHLPKESGLYLKHASTPVSESVASTWDILGRQPDTAPCGIDYGGGVVTPATRTTYSGKAGVGSHA